MKRRVSVLVAVVTLLAGSFGVAGPAAARASKPAIPVAGADVGAVGVNGLADNVPPLAVDDPSASCDYGTTLSFAVPEDTSGYVAGGPCNLLANDTDGDGSVVNWEIVTGPQHGTVTNDLPLEVPGLSSDFTYIPDANYFTAAGDQPGGSWVSDSFTYRAVDELGDVSEPATVRFWVAPVNDPPTFTPGPSTISVSHAPYSAPWASAISAGPNEAGQVVHFEPNGPLSNPSLFSVAPALSSNGTLSFTPASGRSGTATVTFVAKDDGGSGGFGGGQSGAPAADDTSDPVSIEITVAANVPPVAVDDPGVPCGNSGFGGSMPIPEDGDQFVFALSCALPANDSDADGTIASIQIDTQPAHGVLEWLPAFPNTVGYTPAPDWSTAAGDWVSDSFTYHVVDDDGAASNTATVRIWLAPVNDAPTFTAGPATVGGAPGVAHSAAWATAVSAGPNEASQTVHFERTALDLHGTPGLFSVSPSLAGDGTLSFTAAPGQVGTATVTFVAKDDGGLESYAGVTIHPDDTSDPVSFDIVITADNAAPVATDDTTTVGEDAAATAIDVLANDTDGDADGLTISAVTQGARGTVVITGGGTGLTYRPASNANGPDAFTYTIDDGHGGTDTASVDVTVTAVNDSPVAGSNAVTVTEDAVATAVAVLGNDSDVDGDSLSISAVTNGTKGVVAITGGGTGLTYRPNANANGADAFTYTASDGHGGTATASVTVTITPVNDHPNAVNDGVPTPWKVYLNAGATAIPVLANDTWLPDAPETLRIIARTNGSHGLVAITGGGTGLTYTPTGTTTGIDVFTYTISDGHGGSDKASVQVTVAKDSTPPTTTFVTVQKSAIPGTTALKVYVKWAIAESGSGLRSQLLQRRTDSGAWVTIGLASIATRTYNFTLARGHLYTFRVRATDRAGNVGTFAGRQIRI